MHMDERLVYDDLKQLSQEDGSLATLARKRLEFPLALPGNPKWFDAVSPGKDVLRALLSDALDANDGRVHAVSLSELGRNIRAAI